MKKRYIFDLVIGVSLVMLSLLLWLPTRFYPYHWDAAGYVIHEAISIKDRGFWPLDTRFSDFAHPPLLPFLLALTWQLGGMSKVMSHALIFPFLPLLLISVYYIGKKLGKELLGVSVAFLLLATPVVLAEYGNVYSDLPVSSLTVASFALWVYRYHLPSALVLGLAVLMKESALFFLPVFFLMEPLKILKKRPPKYLAYLLIPIIFLAVWFYHHHAYSGWWFVQPERAKVDISTPAAFINSVFFVINRVMIFQNRWLITALAIISLAILFAKEKLASFFTREWTTLAVTMVMVILLYGYIGEFAMRYGIGLIAFFYIVSLMLLLKTIRSITPTYIPVFILIVSMALVAMMTKWHPQADATSAYEFRPPEDLTSVDIINLFRQLGAYATLQGNNVEWYGSFPENIYLSETYQGYVSEKIPIKLCRQYVPNNNLRQLLVLHAYAPEQIMCQQLLEKIETTPIHKMTAGAKWLEIYEVTATASANKKSS